MKRAQLRTSKVFSAITISGIRIDTHAALNVLRPQSNRHYPFITEKSPCWLNMSSFVYFLSGPNQPGHAQQQDSEIELCTHTHEIVVWLRGRRVRLKL